jgi:type IV fimbrial biogenesis protein FimT
MRTTYGFTLPELIVAMAISAVLLAMATPSFSRLAQSQRLVATSNQLLAQIQAARLLAVHRNARVVICGSADGERCSGTPDWSNGTLSFVDANRDGQHTAGESVSRFLSAEELNDLHVRSTIGRPVLAFSPDGHTAGGNLTLQICAPDRQQWRQIVVNLAGRSRVNRPATAVVCPP